MKKLSIVTVLLFLLSVYKGYAQEVCDDLSTAQIGAYNVGDTIFTTSDFDIISDNYFMGGTCGGNGGEIFFNADSKFSVSGNISFNFDCSQKEVKFDFASFAGQCFSLSVNDSVIGNNSDLFLSAIPNVSFSFDTVSNILTMIGGICSVRVGADYMYLDQICVTSLSSENINCTTYQTSNAPDGIYLVDEDTTFIFDSTLYQQVSMQIYGDFNNWDLSSNHQAGQTYFKVNGSDSVSLETIYNNLPYTLNGVVITIDTNDLNVTTSMDGVIFTSGTIIFTGNIASLTMVQFESGIVQICTELINCPNCPCSIDADFTYTNNGHSFHFTSAATGTEYSWSFGDGETSTATDPYHLYSAPGTYEVCLTNYNLTDSCTITKCDSILVECTTPNANIITPNQDGIDDYIELQCNDVKIYDRNGILIIELINETIWEGQNANGNPVPMGEYIIVCTSTGVTTSVTVIW